MRSRYLLTFPGPARAGRRAVARSAAPAARCCSSRLVARPRATGGSSAWVAAACLTIAINGSRELPQYFVQAAPAAGARGGVGRRRCSGTRRAAGQRRRAGVVLAIAVWRVNDFRSWSDNTRTTPGTSLGRIDARRASGALRRSRDAEVLGAGGGELGEFMRGADRAGRHRLRVRLLVRRVRAGGARERVALLLEPAGHRRLQRRASPATASAGCSTICDAPRPAIVALQQRDWIPDVDDSAHFFMTHAARSPAGCTSGTTGRRTGRASTSG